ncbi:MAG: signal peptidase I [Candidatus Aminicenantales bacterium]
MKREKKKKKKKEKREKSTFREYFELIAETAVFVFFVMTFVVQAFQIPTGSMEPTLLIGDFLLVDKFMYIQPYFSWEGKILPRKKLERYDVVVFKYPEDLSKDFVKRVIALEGEMVEIRDKQVYINGQPIPEEYKVHVDSEVHKKDSYYRYNDVIRDNFGPVKVPPGYCFVMGDNRDNSYDSRYWGFLPIDNIKGRPWVIYFSYEAEKNAYLKTSLRERLEKFVNFILKARWRRIFHLVK